MFVVYLLLATGNLSEMIKSIVNRATDQSEMTVDVFGGKSDLHGNTSVDSVIVTNENGLRLCVYGANVSGSVISYFASKHFNSIEIDSLIAVTPLPSGEPSADSTLAAVFGGIVEGFVTRTDVLSLKYGRIMGYDGAVLIDSLSLDASIKSIDTPVLVVEQAAAFIPLFGRAEFSGTLCIDSTRASIEDGATVFSPAGDFILSGYLNADSTLGLSLSGSVSTGFMPDVPPARANLSCSVNGSVSSPEAFLVISEGAVNYQGLHSGFSADSIVADMEGCSVNGLQLRTESASVDIEGSYSFIDSLWNGSVIAGFQGTDISSLLPDGPETDLTGTVKAWGTGTGSKLHSAGMEALLNNSEVMNYSFSRFLLNLTGDSSRIDGSFEVDFAGDGLKTQFEIQIGNDYMPVAWKAALFGFVQYPGVVAAVTDPYLRGAEGLSVNLSGEGTASAFAVNGTIGLEEFSTDSIIASGTEFSGSISSSPEGMDFTGQLTSESVGVLMPEPAVATGIQAYLDMSADGGNFAGKCSLQVAEGNYGDISTGSFGFYGDIGTDRRGISGTGILSADSITAAGNHYSFNSCVTAAPGEVHIDTLTVQAPGNLILSLAGLFNYDSEEYSFSLDNLTLTKAGKLRLISRGILELAAEPGAVRMDTLRLNLPTGEISAEGSLCGDSLALNAALTRVDIASIASMLGIPVSASGLFQAGCQVSGRFGSMKAALDITVDHPTYEESYKADSLTVHLFSSGDSLLLDGLWSWTDGRRSGLRAGFDQIWTDSETVDLGVQNLMWAEAELTGAGDELFYFLPMPINSSGASISAIIGYQRDSGELSAGIASRFERLYLTTPGIEFPGMEVYLTYPDRSVGEDYNGSFSIKSGEGSVSTLESRLLFQLNQNLSFTDEAAPFNLEAYDFRADLTGWETLVAGVGWMKLSGALASSSSDMTEKPELTGRINIDRAIISLGGEGAMGESGGSSGEAAELPVNLDIRISGERGVWLRNSLANAEFFVEIDVTTAEGELMVAGDIEAVRGSVYILGRDFRITTGNVRILQSAPLSIELDILAESRVRSSISGAEYYVKVTLTGDPNEPEMTLTGSGPDGPITEQDIAALLTAGMTYGELQQFDSAALGSVAGNYLGQWLANSIRDDVGLDALQFTPDFSSDSTSLVVKAGKYVLPDLFVSYTSDVFSADAGTISAQYFISRDFFLEGSTKSTLTGSHDPSLELHYTYDY